MTGQGHAVPKADVSRPFHKIFTAMQAVTVASNAASQGQSTLIYFQRRNANNEAIPPKPAKVKEAGSGTALIVILSIAN
jgi:hypothetical protein